MDGRGGVKAVSTVVAPWQARTARSAAELGRVVCLEGAKSAFGEDAIQPLLDATLTADDLGAAALEELTARYGKSGRLVFDQALDHGIESVPNPPDALQRLFAVLDDPPDWVDFDQLRRGSVAYLRAGPLMAFAFGSAVTAANERAYGITRSLVFTGRLAGRMSAVRARETIRWLVAATRPNGMLRGNAGFKLTVQVRMIHAMARRNISRSPRWDWDNWGMPISDADGAYAVSYDFSQALVDACAAVGVRWSERELEDIYALWRYIGHVIGVPEHLLPRSAAHARLIAAMYRQIDPGPDEECRKMYHARMQLAAGLAAERVDLFPRLMALAPPKLRLKLLYGFTRYWAGDEVADALSVPDDAWKHAPRLIRPVMRATEFGRKLRVIDDERLVEATIKVLERAAASPGSAETMPSRATSDSVAPVAVETVVR